MILHTTVLVDLMRGDRSAQRRVNALEQSGAFVRAPTPAVFELWEGAEGGRDPPREQARIVEMLQDLPILDLGRRHATQAGRVGGALARRGVVLDDIDLLIAGMALEEGDAVLTRNVKDFERVPDLRVEGY